MTNRNTVPRIDEYLRERLMPVEGAIPQIPGIEMFGNSVPVGTVGGDLFEYINFQQRYDIDARIQQAQRLSREFLTPLVPGAAVRNSVDDQVRWLKTTPDYKPEMEAKYRFARNSEQVRVAEELRDLYSTAGGCFFATTGPSATLSSSYPFPVLPVIGRTCSSDFSLGRGGLLQFA